MAPPELAVMADILAKQTKLLETLVGEIRILSWRVDRLELAAKKRAATKPRKIKRQAIEG
jgi:hypothetical protein